MAHKWRKRLVTLLKCSVKISKSPRLGGTQPSSYVHEPPQQVSSCFAQSDSSGSMTVGLESGHWGLTLRLGSTGLPMLWRGPDFFFEQPLFKNFQTLAIRLWPYGYFVPFHDRNNYQIDQKGNAYQTSIYFETTNSTTVIRTCAREMTLLPTGNIMHTPHHTDALGGTKLCSYTVFECRTFLNTVKFSRSLVWTNANGFFNENLLVDWFHLVWLLRPGALLKHKNALTLNSFCSQVSEQVKRELCIAGTGITVISGRLASELHTVDFGINRPFKCPMQ